MEKNSPLQPSTVNKLAGGYYLATAMMAGIELDIFNALGKEGSNAADLARRLDLKREKLAPFLHTLVVAGLLTETSGIFANTEETNIFLVKETPRYIGEFYQLMLGTLSGTSETIRTGKSQSKVDFENLPDDLLAAFYRGLHPGTLRVGSSLVDLLGLAHYTHLLDVGGGSGGVVIAGCSQCPNLKGTVIELPKIVPITRSYIREAGLMLVFQSLGKTSSHTSLPARMILQFFIM